jgi:hypothetical protein
MSSFGFGEETTGMVIPTIIHEFIWDDLSGFVLGELKNLKQQVFFFSVEYKFSYAPPTLSAPHYCTVLCLFKPAIFFGVAIFVGYLTNFVEIYISVGLLGSGANGEVYGAINSNAQLISVKFDQCEPTQQS